MHVMSRECHMLHANANECHMQVSILQSQGTTSMQRVKQPKSCGFGPPKSRKIIGETSRWEEVGVFSNTSNRSSRTLFSGNGKQCTNVTHYKQ